jgi:hypothetical protein
MPTTGLAEAGAPSISVIGFMGKKEGGVAQRRAA